jgi:hypothetical protein
MKDAVTVKTWKEVFSAARSGLDSGIFQGLVMVSLQEFNEGNYEAVPIDGECGGYDHEILKQMISLAPDDFLGNVSFRLFIERMCMPGSVESWFDVLVVVYLKKGISVRPKSIPHKSILEQRRKRFE